jgi:ketosteroid isomerase-like protein
LRGKPGSFEEINPIASEADLPIDNSQDIAAFNRMAREFTEGFNSGDVDRLMRFYADRYVDVKLRSPVQTHEQRKAYYLHVMKTRNIRVDVRPDEIVVEGDFAFIRGAILISRADATEPDPTELRYLEIARKDSDGAWKAWWGMDGPLQEYEPARE